MGSGVLAFCKSPAQGETSHHNARYIYRVNYTTMSRSLIPLLFVLFSVYAHTAAARTGTISGRVTDGNGKPLVFASVLLRNGIDSSLIKTELTDEKGEFTLTPVADGNYTVKITVIGYDSYTSDKVTVANNGVNFPTVTLQQKGNELNEVAVRAQKPFVEVHADKLVVNVENSIVNAGSSVLEVLARSPGVTVDQNDNISLKGKQGVNVMINGKIQPLSAADLGNLLKSMPSNSVESIELISNPSAKYDAAGTGGIINITLKKDKKTGLNGSVNGTYAQGVYAKETGGFSMNYRNKNFNFFANYNHSNREGFNHLTIQRDFYNNGIFAGAYQQDNHYLYHIVSDLGGMGMDYNISSKTVVGFVLNGSSTAFLRNGANNSNIIDSLTHRPSSHFSTANNSPNHWDNYAANVNLRHTFDSTGRSLAVDADYASYPSSGIQDYTTRYFDTLGAATSPPQVLKGTLTGLTQIRSVKADYTHPLKNNAKIEAGLKTSYVTADNDLRFYDLIDNVFVPDLGKTYHFIYNENINAGYLNFNKDWPKWSAQVGLRAEQTVVKGDDRTSDSTFTRNYTQLFPSFAVQRHINPDNDLGITLSRRIERPNYEQLNPFKYYLDPTTYKAGYPFLNPALSYSAELSYTYKQKFITTFNYSLTSDPITEVIQPSTTENKVTIQTTKNLTSMAFYGLGGSYQFHFFKWWNNTTNFNAYYARYTGDIAGTNLNDGRATFDVSTNNSFILSKNWSAELSGNYQARQLYGYMELEPTWMVNIGIQKNLFDKRATLRLNATDIFWHGYPSATSRYNDYTEFFVSRRDTRQVALSFTYRFGKRTVPPSARHNGGAEDEKKRVGGQAG
jgi:Outer membrane protein beta-barrel family/Carboxypeptidase regulatory-like domain/TonB-dependent Receptor Plug Domain